MKRLLLIPIVLALLAFTIPPKKVRLEYKFDQGDKFTFFTRADQVITQDIPQMGTQKTINEVESAVSFEAVEVSGRTTRFSVHYQYITMDMQNPMSGGMIVDTRKQDYASGSLSDIMYKTLSGLIDYEFFVTLENNGTVLEIEGAEDLYENALAGLEGVNPQVAEQMKSQIASQYAPEALRENFQSGFIYYSGEKLKKNSTWTNEITTNANIPGFSTLNWKLEEAGNEQCTITLTSEFKSDDEKKVKISYLENVQWKIAGETQGSYQVNTANGWINSSTVEVSLYGTLEIPAGGMIPMDMSIPIEIISKNQYMMEPM